MSLSSSTSIHPTTAAINRSTLSRESILEARQRRRRRIQTQKHSQVQHHHSEGQRNIDIPKTLQNLPSNSGSTVRSLRTRFLDTTSVRGMTMNSMDNIWDDGNSYVLVSEDDDDDDNNNDKNKSTQSMMDKEIDAFILPLDYSSKTYCHTNINDEYEYDPYLLPVSSMMQKKLTEQYHYIENDALVTSSKYVLNDREKNNQTEVTDTMHPQQEVEGLLPPKSSTLLHKASKVILDRRPVPYVGIPTPISRIHHESEKDTTPIHDRNNDSYCSNGSSSNDSSNDIDSIITIQKLLDGISILPHHPPQNSYTSSMSILEQFQQEQQELKQKYQHQPPTFLLLLSHMYGNAYLHEYHDIERAKLWFEYANNQSISNQEGAMIDPLDRYEVNNQRRLTQQHKKKENEKTRNSSTSSNIRKHPDNRLQQSLYRIERLQRWYYEENPDVDENLLFEL